MQEYAGEQQPPPLSDPGVVFMVRARHEFRCMQGLCSRTSVCACACMHVWGDVNEGWEAPRPSQQMSQGKYIISGL